MNIDTVNFVNELDGPFSFNLETNRFKCNINTSLYITLTLLYHATSFQYFFPTKFICTFSWVDHSY